MGRNIDTMSIFGEYKQAEDRVTAALLQIFKAGGEPLLREVLTRAELQLPDNEIGIISQPVNPSGGSRPDGLLRSEFSFNLYIESKLSYGSVEEENRQLREHRKVMNTADNNYLLYITPDNAKPSALKGVYWCNWKTILETLEEYIEDTQIDNYQLVNFLVFEFGKLVDNLNLNPYTWEGSSKLEQVIVLAGAWAEGIACKYGYYFCQNNRSFRPSGYVAFYKNSRISHLFKVVGLPMDDVDITEQTEYRAYIENEEPNLEPGEDKRKVIPLQHERELDIVNDMVDKNGKPCPYTYGQPRYTTMKRILHAKFTSEL